MLKHMAGRRKKPFILGIDWQVDDLRMVLLDQTQSGRGIGRQQLLGQWHLSFPALPLSSALHMQPEWQDFVAQVSNLIGRASLHINVGIPNRLCSWLHCPTAMLDGKTTLVALQLQYQRLAAAALNVDPQNLNVHHLQLSCALSFLVVTKRHYENNIRTLINSVHDQVQGSVVACIEPQGLTRALVPDFLDNTYAMAWFLAHRAGCRSC